MVARSSHNLALPNGWCPAGIPRASGFASPNRSIDSASERRFQASDACVACPPPGMAFAAPLPCVPCAQPGRAGARRARRGPQCRASGVVRVALTRESGKNGALRDAAAAACPAVQLVELPCVSTVPAKGRDLLAERILEHVDGWVVITSPEAAAVFVAAWKPVGCVRLRAVAAVGKATGDVLRAAGIDVEFQPSRATGKALVDEIRRPLYDGELVLYPASAKASAGIVDGLTARGYNVERINTYSTETAVWSPAQQESAGDVDIVTFAAPSAVRGWTTNAGTDAKMPVACIGVTSATAAAKAGFTTVYHPDSPGIDGWVEAIRDALRALSPVSQ